MKLKQLPLALALALVLGAIASGCTRDPQPTPAADANSDAAAHAEADVHAGEHDAAHASAVAGALGVDFPAPGNHEPWEPDAPLIEGMARVRAAVAGMGHGDPARLPDESTVAARAADVDSAIEYMFANCSLDTEPDIALHAILARLMAGTQALHVDPADPAAVADMAATIDNYEQLFDDRDADAGADS